MSMPNQPALKTESAMVFRAIEEYQFHRGDPGLLQVERVHQWNFKRILNDGFEEVACFDEQLAINR